MNIYKMKAGQYYVGDPCYTVQHDESGRERWNKICDLMFENNKHGMIDIEGSSFFFCFTRYGDGVYPLKKNGVFVKDLGVDAGCLSIVPMELVEKWGRKDYALESGKLLNLKNDFTVEADSYGGFKFDEYSIRYR